MSGHWDETRCVLRVSGEDSEKFLQDLVTNDVTAEGAVYAALLTPQGKFLFDFFVISEGSSFLLDVSKDTVDALVARLTMYRLRAKVDIEKTDLVLNRGLGDAPAGSFDDPRHEQMGWRCYSANAGEGDAIDWTAIRVAHCIPKSGIELRSDETFILEAGFERINGVDFKKGCYVGQEVTARMKHKTELRKGFARVSVAGSVPYQTEITCDGKSVGWIASQAGNEAIAYLRFDRAKDGMQAGAFAVERI